MSSLFRGFLRLAVFGTALLAGLQVPGYMDQYGKRVDAHLLEVTHNLSGFQETANQLFDGDLEALITYYTNSNDQVFERDANSIRIIYNRYLRLTREQTAVSAPWYNSAAHILFAADPEIRDEALEQFTYTVTLEAEALEWGVGTAVLITLLVELALVFLGQLSPWRRRQRKHRLT